jgi:hypothetical protein
VSRRSVVGAQILGWSMVVLGAGHLGTVALDAGRTPDRATERAYAGLSQVAVAMPGPQRNLEQLFWGYSLLMGLMVIAFGMVVLWTARHVRGSLRSLLWLSGAVCVAGLAASAILMPIPPLIGFSVAMVGVSVGLSERAPAKRP